jgi:hypothetical protein
MQTFDNMIVECLDLLRSRMDRAKKKTVEIYVYVIPKGITIWLIL